MGFLRNNMEKIRCIYMAFLTVYTIAREVIPLQYLIGTSIMTYGIFILGMLIIGSSIVIDKQYYKIFNIPAMILFIIVCAVTTIVNYQYAFIDNIKAISWMLIFYFVVYPVGYFDKRNGYKITKVIFGIAVVVMTLLMLISLPMYFFDVDFTYYNDNIIGTISSQGFSREFMRLWGIFGDTNTASVYAIAIAYMAVYLFDKQKRRSIRILLIISIVLSGIFVALSGSRTAYVALGVSLAWMGFYFFLAKKKDKKRKFVYAVVCAITCAGIGVGTMSITRLALPHIKGEFGTYVKISSVLQIHEIYEKMYQIGDTDVIDNYLINSGDSDDIGSLLSSQNSIEELKRNDLQEKDDISNGRIAKWMDALEIFMASPLVGASPRGAMEFGRVYCPDNDISQYGVAAHNFLLEILMGTGIVGVLVALIILVRGALRVLNLAFKEFFKIEIMIFGAVLLGFVCASLFVSDLFFVLTFGGTAFWYLLGAVCYEPDKIRTTSHDDGKKHVLIYGPKDPIGGVEKIVFEYVRNIIISHDDIIFDFIVYGKNFSMESELLSMGCRVLYLPSRRKNLIAYKTAIKHVFSTTTYSAVWGNYSGLTNIDLLILAKNYGVPKRIAHSHGSRLYWGNRVMKYVVYILHYYNKFFRLTNYATDYWACSRMAGCFMFPKNVHSKMSVIPNAVDTGKFYPDLTKGYEVRRCLAIPKSDFVIGHVARMCEVKNQIFLLRIMKEIIRLNSDAKLLFVGDGELREDIEREIRRLDLQNQVILTGDRDDVPNLLRAMNVFVLTSFSEGLSVSAVEAQACGLPCVLPTTVSSETDIIGIATFLSLDDDAEIWAREILKAREQDTEFVKQKLVESGYDMSSAANCLYRNFIQEDMLST